jgi:hypothetical protein
MKFSDFNNEEEMKSSSYGESNVKMPIREEMHLPTNPPLFSDQYGHRQTSSPLYVNPYERTSFEPSSSSFYPRLSTTSPTSYYPAVTGTSYAIQPPSMSHVRQNGNYFMSSENMREPFIKPQVTELFTIDKAPPISDHQPASPLTSTQSISCLDVNDHIVTCPICSNYYKSYSYLYIGIIIILLIIILFLFKSLSEKM